MPDRSSIHKPMRSDLWGVVLGGRLQSLCASFPLCLAWRLLWLVVVLLAETTANASDSEFDFDVPPGAAGGSLVQFAKQANIQLLFPYHTVSAVQLNGLSGRYTVKEGIEVLISGTCLKATFITEAGTALRIAEQKRGFWLMKNDNCQQRRLISAISMAIAAVVGAPGAAAQSLQSGNFSGLEEIIVTAQKYEQSLQDTPAAISAFNASALEQRGISDVFDIRHSVPNLQIAETPSNSTAATIAIRGSVTVNPAITWEPPVSLYLDGVFIGKNIGSIFDIVELDRVEVLRGPQGTLYGKNTIGGAINLITRKPSGEFSGKLKTNIGNKNLYSGFVSIDTPAVDFAGGNLMANIGAFFKQRDGFIKNIPDPANSPLAGPSSSKSFKEVDNEAVRFALLWAGAAANVMYSFDYSNVNNTPTAGQLTDVAENLGVDMLIPYLVSDSKRASAISNNSSLYEDSKVLGHALHIEWDAGSWGPLGDVDVRSITSYRKLAWRDTTDLDGSPLSFYVSSRHIDYEQAAQEIQLVGKTERVNYVAGLYYFNEKSDNLSRGAFMGVFGYPPSRSEYGMKNGKSIAVFGQADWQPDWSWAEDRLTLSAGLRWTEEDKKQYLYRPGTIPYTEAREKWTNTSPTFIAGWELSDDISMYGKITKGWKAGGFNGESPTQSIFEVPYDPEQITAYELGLKSRWLNNRLQINLAAFKNKLTDMQFTVFAPEAGSSGSAATTVGNAGKATIRGFEFELLARPIDLLTISVSYGYLDPEYDEFLEVDPLTGEIGDFKDSRDFPYAARNTGSVGLEYEVGNFEWGKLTTRLDWSYQGHYLPYVLPAQNRVSEIKTYDLLNARVTLSDIRVNDGQSLRIAAWGKNLADKNYRVGTIPFGLWTTSYFGEPRSYGIELSYQF